MTELVIDSFAGGGGASRGIELALGRSPDIAINHDAEALAMHAINHPTTRHLPANVWKVDPADVCAGRPVGLLWASPDCKHHSKAKGGKPVSRAIRDLAWVVVRWAKQVRPRVILLENVEEFRGWGPVDRDGLPCRERKGQTFELWIGELRRLGYRVEWRELRACDFGAPTIRKRLFVAARCDGKKIVWPAPTHGDPKSEAVRSGKLPAWPTAAGIIDWSLPCHSIFLTREEGRKAGVNRPLAEATMARIAKGVRRYVIEAARPFVVPLSGTLGGFEGGCSDGKCGGTLLHAGRASAAAATRGSPKPIPSASPFVAPITHAGGARVNAIDEPLRTVTTAHRGEQALVAPLITKFRQGSAGASIEDPLATVTSNSFVQRPGGAAPIGVAAVHLQRQNGRSIAGPLDEPLVTITGKQKAAVVAAHITKFAENSIGHRPDGPLHTAMAGAARHGVVAAFMAQHNGGPRPGDTGHEIGEPVSTVTSTGAQQAIVAGFLAQHNTDMVGHEAREPVSTIVGKGCTQAVVSAGLLNLKGSDRRGAEAHSPAPTICAGGWHVAEVRAFLTKYYGSAQDPKLEDPLHTVTVRDRFGLVMVDGEPHEIVDIGMRMLSPRELFRAQGFGDDYIIDRGLTAAGERIQLTKTAQVRMCGNSVCPPVAAALVKANYKADEVPASRRSAAAAVPDGLFGAVA